MSPWRYFFHLLRGPTPCDIVRAKTDRGTRPNSRAPARDFVGLVLLVLDVCEVYDRAEDACDPGPEPPSLFGQRGFKVAERYITLTDKEFRSRYKIDVESFKTLVEKLRPILEKDPLHVKRGGSAPILVELRLSATIRWLCGGAYQDICDLHAIATSSFFLVLRETILGINAVERLPLHTNTLKDLDYLMARAKEEEEYPAPGGGWARCEHH
eukprot:564882-Prorocentrum_minimum.AAC.1